MGNKILQRKCPRCGENMTAHVEDDEFLATSIRLFKAVVCTPCGNFGGQLARINALKEEAWVTLNRLKQIQTRLLGARASGSKQPNLSAAIVSTEKEITETRTGLARLEEKENDVSNRRALHEQQLKER